MVFKIVGNHLSRKIGKIREIVLLSLSWSLNQDSPTINMLWICACLNQDLMNIKTACLKPAVSLKLA